MSDYETIRLSNVAEKIKDELETLRISLTIGVSTLVGVLMWMASK